MRLSVGERDGQRDGHVLAFHAGLEYSLIHDRDNMLRIAPCQYTT